MGILTERSKSFLWHDPFLELKIKSLKHFFDDQLDFVFYRDIPGMLVKIGLTNYFPPNWRIFINSLKKSQKCILLDIINVYRSITNIEQPLMKNMTQWSVLQHIKYNFHQYVIYVDFKIMNFLLAHTELATQHTHSFFVTGSRDKANLLTKKDCPVRDQFNVGEKKYYCWAIGTMW